MMYIFFLSFHIFHGKKVQFYTGQSQMENNPAVIIYMHLSKHTEHVNPVLLLISLAFSQWKMFCKEKYFLCVLLFSVFSCQDTLCLQTCHVYVPSDDKNMVFAVSQTWVFCYWNVFEKLFLRLYKKSVERPEDEESYSNGHVCIFYFLILSRPS